MVHVGIETHRKAVSWKEHKDDSSGGWQAHSEKYTDIVGDCVTIPVYCEQISNVFK